MISRICYRIVLPRTDLRGPFYLYFEKIEDDLRNGLARGTNDYSRTYASVREKRHYNL